MKTDGIFLSMLGATGLADDMIIFRKTDQEHDGNLPNFLELCRKNSLTLNPDNMSSDFQKFPSLAIPGVTRSFSRSKED